ncbi:MAG: hypothetical protein AMXMBFR80_11390 [Dehalococcoidia bacterium]
MEAWEVREDGDEFRSCARYSLPDHQPVRPAGWNRVGNGADRRERRRRCRRQFGARLSRAQGGPGNDSDDHGREREKERNKAARYVKTVANPGNEHAATSRLRVGKATQVWRRLDSSASAPHR